MSVLLYHATLQWWTTIAWPSGVEKAVFAHGAFLGGWAGVDAFFCISGFVIMWVHGGDLGRPERAPRYIARRFLRIYPPYLLFLLLKTAFYLAQGDWGASDTPPLARFYNAVFLLPGDKVVEVAWTLSFEALFYVLFCAAILLPTAWRRGAVATWFAAILVRGAVPGALDPFAAFLFSPYHLEFLCGVAAAALARRSLLSRGRAWLMAVGAGGVLMAAFSGEPPADDDLRSKALLGAAFGSLLWASSSLERAWGPRIPGWLLGLGAASYSIYLVHNEVLTGCMKWGSSHGWTEAARAAALPWIMGATAAAAVLAGILYHFAVERPLRRLLAGAAPTSSSPSSSAPPAPPRGCGGAAR